VSRRRAVAAWGGRGLEAEAAQEWEWIVETAPPGPPPLGYRRLSPGVGGGEHRAPRSGEGAGQVYVNPRPAFGLASHSIFAWCGWRPNPPHSHRVIFYDIHHLYLDLVDHPCFDAPPPPLWHGAGARHREWALWRRVIEIATAEALRRRGRAAAPPPSQWKRWRWCLGPCSCECISRPCSSPRANPEVPPVIAFPIMLLTDRRPLPLANTRGQFYFVPGGHPPSLPGPRGNHRRPPPHRCPYRVPGPAREGPDP